MGMVVALGTKWSNWKEEWVLGKIMCQFISLPWRTAGHVEM